MHNAFDYKENENETRQNLWGLGKIQTCAVSPGCGIKCRGFLSLSLHCTHHVLLQSDKAKHSERRGQCWMAVASLIRADIFVAIFYRFFLNVGLLHESLLTRRQLHKWLTSPISVKHFRDSVQYSISNRRMLELYTYTVALWQLSFGWFLYLSLDLLPCWATMLAVCDTFESTTT